MNNTKWTLTNKSKGMLGAGLIFEDMNMTDEQMDMLGTAIDAEFNGPPLIGTLLQRLRIVLDEMEEHTGALKALQEQKDTLRRDIISQGQSQGVDSFSGAGMTCRIEEKMRARYDPAVWDSIVDWAVKNDCRYIIHRRLSDAKIIDLAESGTPLPDGLSLEPYTDLSVRRK